jgi:hypothetical protein
LKGVSILCLILLLSVACAANPPKKEPQILAVSVTFRGQLLATRVCESRGLVRSLEAAEVAGANLAMAFASPGSQAPDNKALKDVGLERAWIPYNKERSYGTAGFRAFKCPSPFLEVVEMDVKRSAGSRE